MSNFPFGFGALYGGGQFARTSDTPELEDPALPPADAPEEEKKSGWGQQMIDQISWGVKHGGGHPMAAMMGMMGAPWHQKGGGNWMTINPARRAVYLKGTTPFGLGGYTGYNGGNGNGDGNGDGDGSGDGSGNGGGDGNGGSISDLLKLLYPPPIGSGAQWRNTMKYGA